MGEILDVVDLSDDILGQASVDEVYEKKLPHRIVHVMVVNPTTGEIYIQKRAESKSFLPGYYCTSAGGHVRAGESYEAAAARELREELGVDANLRLMREFKFASDGHLRFIQMFLAFVERGFVFSDGEVASGEFMSFEAIRQLMISGEKVHPQLRVCFDWLYDHAEDML